VSYVILILVATLLCCLQHAGLAVVPVVPDLPLALAAWVMIDGSDRGVLMRAWLVGLIRDLIDPGSVYFHTILYLLLALAFVPARAFVFHSRAVAWFGWAMICSLIASLIDRKISGAGDFSFGAIVLMALMTGVAVVPMAMILRLLPRPLRPVGQGRD
jgi:hypothetical protein